MNRRIYVEGTSTTFEMEDADIVAVAREVVSKIGYGKTEITVGILDQNGSLEGWYKATIDASLNGCGAEVNEQRNSGYNVGHSVLFVA
jgi:hypothetical protein